MSDNLIRVTVTREDVKDVPAEAMGPGSMLAVVGTAADGSRVAFSVSGRFVDEVRASGEITIDLGPHEILADGAE